MMEASIEEFFVTYITDTLIQIMEKKTFFFLSLLIVSIINILNNKIKKMKIFHFLYYPFIIFIQTSTK